MDYTNRLEKNKNANITIQKVKGDMIEVFKIANEMYDHKVVTGFLN